MKVILRFLNILSLVVLLLSCLAAYIDPNIFWQFSFIGFAFPVVLVINFAFLVLWLLLLNRFALVPAIAIFLSWNFLTSVFALNFTKKNEEKGLKVMTWNVKNFDLYNWSHNIETRSRMMDLIKTEKPDVLCLQEFYTNNQLFHNLEYITDTLGYPYFYFPPGFEQTKKPRNKLQKTLWKSGLLVQKWGVATFSKYPITDTGMVSFTNALTNRCIYTDLSVEGKKMRLYNVHFQSIHLANEDYATIDSLEATQQTRWTAVKGIMRKMKNAYTKRALQAAAVRKNMNGYDGFKMLCGDFNDVPVSYTYNTVRDDLQDAFIEKGKGFGATFVKKFSIFRIDYMLYDKRITANSCKTIRQPLSDHYPVIATFSFN